MAAVQFLPLATAGLLLAPVVVATGVARLDRLLTRVALVAFAGGLDRTDRRRRDRQRALWEAHVARPYREYAVRAALFATVLGVAGGVLGYYAAWGATVALTTPTETLAETLPSTLGYLADLGGRRQPETVGFLWRAAGVGVLAGVGVSLAGYYYRWAYPRVVADERGRQIDMTMPMTVSFVYALSRSGMSFPEVMRILAENDGTYGHAAREVGVAVRNVDLFGADVVTAVKTMARRTPSTQFQEFAENLSSVLQTGGSLSEFLHRQYREFRQEAEAQQQRLLEMVATLAEVYVTGLVAGPLFLITLLVVAAISVGGVLPVLRLLVYVLLPLANVGFIVYVGTVVDTLGREEPAPEDVRVNAAPAGVRRARDRLREAAGDRTAIEPERAATDGGVEAPALSAVDRANLARLAAYERYRQLQRRLGSPLRTVVRRPTTLLWVTFPVAVFLVGIRLPGTLADGVLTVAEFDDLLIQSILFLAGTFAVAYEVHRRRVDAIEAVVPDMLDRLASLNEAGMTVVESLDRVRESDLGALDREVETIWADVQWGADVQTALRRFERRVRTQTVSRIVTLTTEAMRASGDVGAVLRIAADQAKSDRRLKEERRQEMFFYVLVVYISFFVFLFIVGVLSEVLIPQLPEGGIVANATASDDVTTIPAVENLGNFDEAAFRLLFLHTVVVQGTFSGLVAGQLSTGDLRAGAKHVTVLVAVGYGLLLVFV